MFDELEQKKDQIPAGGDTKIDPPVKKPPFPPTSQGQGVVQQEKKSDKKVDDIFAGLEDSKPPLDKEGKGSAPVGAKTPPGEEEGKKSSLASIMKILIIVVIVLVILVLGLLFAAKYFNFGGFSSSEIEEEAKTEEQVEGEEIIPTKEESGGETEEVLEEEPVEEPLEEELEEVDTDGDGLTDIEEEGFGTDPIMADTDADGLTDYEEIIEYETDPKNPDTDGDGYTDGVEVEGGYNPNGDGEINLSH